VVNFIDAHKGRFGVAPICRVLSDYCHEHGFTIAPSTYYEAKSRAASRRALRDDDLKIEIARVHGENYGVYGPGKVWLQLNREGIEVAALQGGTIDECPWPARDPPRQEVEDHDTRPAPR
jgi:putative transposase